MDTISKIIVIVFAVFILWQLYRYIRAKPEALSWASLNKSFSSMGLLALALIAFIAVVVLLLRRH